MKMKTYIPTFDYTVKAIQFWHKNLIQKVWSDDDYGFVIRMKDRDRSRHCTVRYVLHGQSQYLNDGDWIVISSDNYAHIEPNDYFKRAYKLKKK